MLGLENTAAFVLAAALVIAVPGPATIHVAAKARYSVKIAGLAVAGIVAGDVVLITLSGLGFAALVSKWPILLLTIKIIGAVYVAYLGIGLLRAKPDAHSKAPAEASSIFGDFIKGLLITLTNPKPILFFAAFFPMFIDKTTRSWMQSFYALGALFEFINLIYFCAITAVICGFRTVPALERWSGGGFNKVSGAGLMLCAALILATMH